MSKLEELIQELCPDGVEYKQLKDLGVFYGGLTGKSKDDFENGNKIFITYKNVYSNPSLDLHPDERVKIGETENQRTLEYGDVIFTGSSETPDECGISSVVTETPQDDLYLNSFCFIFRFNDLNGIYPPFMKHLFRSSSIRKQIGRTANGVTRYNVSKKLMAKISIPIPPLEVQQEIVHLLDDFTAKTAELQAELNKEYEARKKQYEYYREMLLKNCSNSTVVRLGDICSVITKGTTPKVYTKTGVTFIKTEAISNAKIDPCKLSYIDYETNESTLKRSKLQENDLLITIAGATIGKCLLIPKWVLPANTNQALAIIRLSTGNPHYVLHVLQSSIMKTYIKNMVKGSAQPNLNLKQLNDFQFNFPSLESQAKIVDTLDYFNSICDKLQSKISSELESRQKQYEYYRDKLLTFKELNESEVN